MRTFCSILFALLGLAILGRPGEFVNLDFDSPDLSNIRPKTPGRSYEAPIGEALRGWTVSWDWIPPYQPYPDYIYIGDASAAPLGLVNSPPYRLSVDSYWGSPDGPLRPPLHLWQVGTVPGDAVELWYYATWYVAWPPFVADPPSILINDEALPFYPSPSGLAVNVARYAGQEVKLEVFFPSGKWQYHAFDIYGFVTIPETSTSVLMLLGGGVLLSWRMFRRGSDRAALTTLPSQLC